MSEDKPRTYRTRSGRELTDADIEALADEAERGYDIEHLKEQDGFLDRLSRVMRRAIGLRRNPD
jgi:hypothetical protein